MHRGMAEAEGVDGMNGKRMTARMLLDRAGRAVRPRPGRHRRDRGVASVLSMMFLVLFGSLGAAMAIASRGNLRTAQTHLHVMRAMGAAETGLTVAEARMSEAASRFVIEKGQIDSAFGERLWTGAFDAGDGEVQVLPPPSGHEEYAAPTGLADALVNLHAADQNIVEVDGITAPTIGPAPAGTDAAVYSLENWVTTPAIPVAQEADGDGPTPAAFQITYAPLADGTGVRAIVTGFDFDYARNGVPLTRTVSRDFRLAKRVDQAVVSPSRIMIGKNVMVSGDLGAIYDAVDEENGHPVVLRSDFAGLDAVLDEKLADFQAAVADADVNSDNRLRVGHGVEGAGIPVDADYDGDGEPDNAFADATADGAVDEFDIFIRHFDQDGDGRVVLSAALTAGTPNAGKTPEFELDEDLALLIDSAFPDRNRNGVYGFTDDNGNGRWDDGEQMADLDPVHGTFRDQVLGYRDGVIDRRDRYGKVSGRLVFRVEESDWAAADADYRDQLAGPIRPENREAPMTFGADESVLPPISAESFTGTQTALQAAADGASFTAQVAEQLGVAEGDLADYEETSSDPDEPRYYRLDPDEDGDGLPDNWSTAYFERMPFNSPNTADWYYRPVYENMTFRNVQIPMGTNALFRNCTFVGVTYVRCHTDNTHVNWTHYGRMQLDEDSGRPVPEPERTPYGDDAGEDSFPTMLPESAIPPEQILSMALASPLDKADVPDDMTGTISNYDDLPDPLVIDGKRITDTKTVSNNLRFHDCLFVGSIISDTPAGFTQVRNKMQFTGSTRFAQEHPDYPDDPSFNPDEDDIDEIVKSSMMLPNYSVDIGSFNSPPEQDVRLTGAIIAGVMDVRGNADINGALLLTFAPVAGEAPLVDQFGNPVGNPANFNTTLGYFGPDDGDEESLDPATLPEVDGVKIVGWDLDGDGLADLGPDDTPSDEEIADGATPVPFYGYGRVTLTFNPDLIMPDGLLLPVRVDPVGGSYREGRR